MTNEMSMVALFEQANIWQNEPIAVKRGDIFLLGKHRLMCGNSSNGAEVAMLLQEETPDLIFADPPYGIGIDAWDKPIEDVSLFIELVTRHLKPGGFFAFTHQMPHMIDWLYTLKHSALKYKDHIAWVKRTVNAICLPLLRSHESLFIYAKGKADYYQTKGLYEDVKVPGILFDVVSIEAIDRHIKDLVCKIKGTSSPRNVSNKNFKSYHYMSAPTDRSPEEANFTNVWSFLPENQGKRGGVFHATSKPILLMNRLLELCTPENALVYDAFLGSGTTLMSAESTNRTCYGMELSPQYCSDIIQRWQEATGQRAEKVEVA